VTRESDDPQPWRTTAAAGHAQQFFQVSPAVIELTVPVSLVLDRDGRTLTTQEVSALIALQAPELSITPPGDLRWIKEIHPTRRRVELTAVAGILRISNEDLVAAIKAGRVPEPRPAGPGEDWTWFEDELHRTYSKPRSDRQPLRWEARFESTRSMYSLEVSTVHGPTRDEAKASGAL
jgi:hypothetical protein